MMSLGTGWIKARRELQGTAAALPYLRRCSETLVKAVPLDCPLESRIPDTKDQQNSRPLVVLFGWFWARPRYFEKYCDAWRNKGFPVMGIRASPLLLPFLADAKAATLLKQISSSRMQQHKDAWMVYHAFSNAGFVTMTKVLQAAHARADPHRARQAGRNEALVGQESEHAVTMEPRGIIFDSAPARFDSKIVTEGVISAALNEPVEGLATRHPILYGTVLRLARVLLRLPYLQQQITQVWGFWDTQAPTCRQLYLYSDADAIIDEKAVEAFAAAQGKRQVAVRMHKWKGSGHCAHLRIALEGCISQAEIPRLPRLSRKRLDQLTAALQRDDRPELSAREASSTTLNSSGKTSLVAVDALLFFLISAFPKDIEPGLRLRWHSAQKEQTCKAESRTHAPSLHHKLRVHINHKSSIGMG
ncbi:hypothetical protein WJX84_011782 [Apatococcus fuscideae]|uniref:Uncharacterized protein n=1 Tax=Apatococcus fuscideae TaxID=2026836 RepID=A0AAW1T8V3_9CHLO